MKNTDREFLKRSIAFHPFIARAFDSINLAILWQQIYYWTDKGHDPDGWIYKTQIDITEETGLSRKNQETTRKLGEKLGVLESKRMGVQGVVHFRIDLEKAYEIIDKYAEKNPSKKPLFRIKEKEPEIKTEVAIGLPEWINHQAWDEWELHRKEIKHKLTPSTRKSQLKFLEKFKEDHVEIIRTSIQNGWTGLFQLKKFGRPTNVLQPTPGKYAKLSK
jgi:hypothetical protein